MTPPITFSHTPSVSSNARPPNVRPINVRKVHRTGLKAQLPPPLVTIGAIKKLLLRQVTAPSSGHLPEQRLLVAVICQAILDLRCGSAIEQRQARCFLLDGQPSGVLNKWTQWLDLEPVFIREVATKTNYLLPQNLLSEKAVGGSSCEVSNEFLSRRPDAGFQPHTTSA